MRPISSHAIRFIPKTKDPIAAFVDMARKRKWDLVAAIGKNPATETDGEIKCWVPDRNTVVNLRDDLLTGVHYFMVFGPGQEAVAEEIRTQIESYSEEELLAWWDRAVASNDVDDKVDAVLFLSVGAPAVPAEQYVSRIKAALRDPDKDVRNAAIVGAGYSGWSLFIPDLERMHETDADETARKRAGMILDILRSHVTAEK